MTGEIVNLRQARKRKARTEREKVAADNRIRFGKSKAERVLQEKLVEKATKHVDAHRLDTRPVDETISLASPSPDKPSGPKTT